jgi:hypothetical protein
VLARTRMRGRGPPTASTQSTARVTLTLYHRLSAVCPHTDRCVTDSAHSAIVLLSLKAMGQLLRWRLPSQAREAPAIGRAALQLLGRSGTTFCVLLSLCASHV